MPGLSRPALKEEYVSPEWKQWLASGCPPGIDNYEPLVEYDLVLSDLRKSRLTFLV